MRGPAQSTRVRGSRAGPPEALGRRVAAPADGAAAVAGTLAGPRKISAKPYFRTDCRQAAGQEIKL